MCVESFERSCAQMSSLPAIETIQAWITDHPKDDLRVEKLAKLIGEPIPDLFREVYVQAVNRMVYRIHNGEEWVRVDDPSADKVWSSMEIEPERREAMREFYAAPDKEADLLKIMNRPGGFEDFAKRMGLTNDE